MNSEETKPAMSCPARAVLAAMQEDQSLEAIRIKGKKRSVSAAFHGTSNQPAREAKLVETMRAFDPDGSPTHCELLNQTGDCRECPFPLTLEESRRLRIERSGSTTTISRAGGSPSQTPPRWRKLTWPRIVPRTVLLPGEEPHEEEWKPQMLGAVLCGVFTLAAHVVPGEPIWLYLLAYLAGGWFTFGEVLERLKKGVLDIHFLMLAVAGGSAAIGAWNEGGILLFLFSFSSALEHYALGRTEREIQALFRAAPKTATCLDAQGNETTVPVESLAAGMRLLIKPGDQVPADAELIEGETAVDESNLTGEALPVEKKRGDSLLGGTLNTWGAVQATVVRPASESALERIMRLIRGAQQARAPAQRFTDKFGPAYTYFILGLSSLMFFVWWGGFGLDPFSLDLDRPSAFYRSMTLLVAASPCALVLSIPSAILAAIAWAARRGILFRGGAAVERLASVRLVALDKTGTLTTGDLQVERFESFPGGEEAEVARLAFSLERFSTHPLARAITRYGKRHALTPRPVESFQSMAGFGLRAEIEGEPVYLGRRDWILENLTEEQKRLLPPPELGTSEVWVATRRFLGRVVLRDEIRPQAKEVIARLRRMGLATLILTGDRREAANLLQETVQADEVRAGLQPQEKVACIQEIKGSYGQVAMIGDGVNDAPSLAAADIGVAMGARGSDAALEQADLILMHDRLENFLVAYQLSRKARRVIRQNLVLSLGTVVVLSGFALAGAIPLSIGVVGHEGSTVLVVLNSLRLLAGPEREPRQS